MMCLNCDRSMVEARLVVYRGPSRRRLERYGRMLIWICTRCGREQTQAQQDGVLVLRAGRRRPLESGVRIMETQNAAVIQGVHGRDSACPIPLQGPALGRL